MRNLRPNLNGALFANLNIPIIYEFLKAKKREWKVVPITIGKGVQINKKSLSNLIEREFVGIFRNYLWFMST